MPSWNSSELWYESACNQVLNAPEKKYLFDVLKELLSDRTAQAIFLETANGLNARKSLTEVTLIHELNHDPRWEVRVELLVQRLKLASVRPVPPHSHSKIVRVLRRLWTHTRKLMKDEHVQKGVAQVAATVAGVGLSVPVAIKLVQASKLDYKLPIAISGSVDPMGKLKVSLTPEVDTSASHLPIPIPIQWSWSGNVTDGLPTVKVQFAPGPSGLRVVPIDCHCAASPVQSVGERGEPNPDSELAKRVDGLAELVAKLATTEDSLDVTVKKNTADLEMLGKSLTRLQAETTNGFKESARHLDDFETTESKRVQNIPVSLGPNEREDVILEWMDPVGLLKNCTASLTTGRITKKVAVTLNYGACRTGVQPETLVNGDSRTIDLGSSHWTLMIESVQTPLLGKNAVRARWRSAP